ncbi:FAD-dependent monooxygenase [Bradyrhizobium canariense]|uniref:2-polyprenyl-6-methoxyphenol hydroxylase n=1 Tax=Bradyrhizobium canariense TaxID=255045 RepID=A0A1H1NGC4_9BRAD|nr:FAD-dependent monooxygenase [Bradyrhizobium canariense]SDR97369.1 2-polyprenyl-6-methoxyphenol hydroxylase [Bradyrhizobium canariense]
MRILIVGAGIAGLALAKAMEQRGMEAQLIERQREVQTAGAGLFLPGNAVRAIEQLGLFEDVAVKAVPIKRQLIFDAGGKVLNTIETEDFWRGCGPCLSLPRKEMQDVLKASLRRSTTAFGRSIASLVQDSAGCLVTFDDGAAAKYDFVVGADGMHSKVRELVSLGGSARYVGTVCWRFIAKNTSGIDCWTAMLGSGRTLLAIPVNRTDVYVYADIAIPGDGAPDLPPDSPLRSLFKDFSGPVFPLIDGLSAETPIHYGPIEEVRLKDWINGRVVLLGDAAHGCSPNMAEGAGMAMEDALVLAEELSRGTDITKALRAYMERRRPRVDWVQNQCRARDKMRSLPALPRAAVLRLFGTSLYKRSYSPLLKSF